MSGKREVRAWRITPVFDPEPGSICNAGTTLCIASGEYLLGTDVGEALSPAIVRQLRRTDVPRIVCDGWQPVATAPKGDDDFYLVCGQDAGSAFVVRGSILWSARKPGTPRHLTLNHITHWMPVPPAPSAERERTP